MSKEQARYLDHPWREYAGPATNHCRKCGASISHTIQLCEKCKRRFNVWISDSTELRFIETKSLDMGSSPGVRATRAVYA